MPITVSALSLGIYFLTSGPAALAAEPDPAPCLSAMARVKSQAIQSSWAGGALPRAVKYNRPLQDLLVWKQADGSLLVLDGKGVQSVPQFSGSANGTTFIRSPEGDEQIMAPTTYRKVQLADGRTFELHRLGDGASQMTLLRGDAEDEAALKYEDERLANKDRVSHQLFGEHVVRLEKACEEGAKRFSDKSLGEQFSSFLSGVANSSRLEREPEGGSAAMRAEMRYIEMDLEEMRALKARRSALAQWRAKFAAMAPERTKKVNLLAAVPLTFTKESADQMLKAAAAEFTAHTRLEALDDEDRASLGVCADYVSLPAKAAKKEMTILERGARSAMPIEYALLMDFFLRAKKEEDARRITPVETKP